MASKIGAITIGQSPRTDVLPEINRLLGDIIVEQRGALDGLSFEEIRQFAPQAGDYVLVTRLNDGRSVQIAEQHILPRMQNHINSLCRQGVDGILLLCTGEFSAFAAPRPLLYPQQMLQSFVQSTVSQQTLGILMPSADQLEQAAARWHKVGCPQVFVAAANPYQSADSVTETAMVLKQQGAHVLVMDCIGYTWAMKKAAAAATGLPVILPRTVAARAVAELFGQ